MNAEEKGQPKSGRGETVISILAQVKRLKGCYVSVYAQLCTVQDFWVCEHRVITKLHEKILDMLGKH